MSNSDYKLCNIVDSQLEDITSELSLPVITGSSSSTFRTVNAQGGTGNINIQFQCQIPNMSTAVNRHILAQTDVDLIISITGGDTPKYWSANEVLFAYGQKNALQAFPLNSLIATMNAQINDSNVTVSSREVMSALLKMYNYEELAKYNSLTPSLVDSFYYDYQDGLESNNNVLANYSTGTFSKEFQPRGCFPVELLTMDGKPYVEVVDGVTKPLLVVTADADGTAPFASFILRFRTTEPLLFLSPFISGNCKNHASFLGINTLNVTMNMGDATRVMSNASYGTHDNLKTKTISLVTFDKAFNSRLLMNYLTIPPALMAKIEPKNVVNYNQYQPFNTMTGESIAPGGSAELVFNSTPLNTIPSKILIYAKKPNASTYDSNSFLAIEKISMNFANKDGLLSNASQADLYNMSVKNGLQMNFYEFSGKGVSNDLTGKPSIVPTTGSILVLDPAIDLSIDSEYTNMSKGQFSTTFTLSVRNQTKEVIKPIMYMVCVNAGVFITERGSSHFNTGILDQEQVLATKTQVAVMDKSTYENEIVGGSIENLGHIHKHMKLNFHKATEKEKAMDDAPGESLPTPPGGAMSAGGLPKRRLHKYEK
jgi:hypothetical protein